MPYGCVSVSGSWVRGSAQAAAARGGAPDAAGLGAGGGPRAGESVYVAREVRLFAIYAETAWICASIDYAAVPRCRRYAFVQKTHVRLAVAGPAARDKP